jgi:hypothetical protein
LCKPTLTNLEKKFEVNKSLLQQQKERVTTAIDWSFAGRAPDWPGFNREMEMEGISVVLQKADKDGEEGIFFIDHRDKCVFSGQGLDIKYSLQAIRERCVPEQEQVVEEVLRQHLHLGL